MTTTRYLVSTTNVKHASLDCPALKRARKAITFEGVDGLHCPGRNCQTSSCSRARVNVQTDERSATP